MLYFQLEIHKFNYLQGNKSVHKLEISICHELVHFMTVLTAQFSYVPVVIHFICKARIWQMANASQKYLGLLACHPDSGRQEAAGQPISRQSPKLQTILVHIYTD